MHTHADLYRQLAEVAQTSDEPWREFEENIGGAWSTCSERSILFLSNLEYRRKPRTVTINGFEVPTPYQGMMEEGRAFFIACAETKGYTYEDRWNGGSGQQQWRKRGLTHLTQEAAALHGKALSSFTEQGE